MQRRSTATGGLSRRQAMTAAAALPLAAALPTPAAARGPRYRKRRRNGGTAPEGALFTHEPLTLERVHRFIDRQWAHLARALARPGRRRPDYRLGDLLAGLALRYGRPQVLAALAAAVAPQPAWQARRAKWLEEGPWRQRWTTAPTLAWSWHDGGVLTRSLLPLKLSS